MKTGASFALVTAFAITGLIAGCTPDAGDVSTNLDSSEDATTEAWVEDLDDPAKALALAVEACSWVLMNSSTAPGSQEFYRTLYSNYGTAMPLASQAAYFDERWRPLADALPRVRALAGEKFASPSLTGFDTEGISAIQVSEAECLAARAINGDLSDE